MYSMQVHQINARAEALDVPNKQARIQVSQME